MTTESRIYTYLEAEQAAAHLERWELVQGRIIDMPAPGLVHAIVVRYLWRLLDDFVTNAVLGYALTNFGVVTQRDPDSMRIPDVLVVSQERLQQRSAGVLVVGPELAVEVKSPDNSWPELHRKALEYLEAGTDAVWIFDPIGRRTRVYSSPTDYTNLGEADVIHGTGLLDGFSVPVRAMYDAAAPFLEG